VRSLALDPITGDFALSGVSGAARLTVVSGADAVAQRIRGRVRLWLGEWFLDTSIGVPYLTMLGRKGAERYVEATLRRVIASCPGVAALESFALTLDAPTRSASIAFRVRATDGAVVEDSGFRVATSGTTGTTAAA